MIALRKDSENIEIVSGRVRSVLRVTSTGQKTGCANRSLNVWTAGEISGPSRAGLEDSRLGYQVDPVNLRDLKSRPGRTDSPESSSIGGNSPLSARLPGGRRPGPPAGSEPEHPAQRSDEEGAEGLGGCGRWSFLRRSPKKWLRALAMMSAAHLPQ